MIRVRLSYVKDGQEIPTPPNMPDGIWFSCTKEELTPEHVASAVLADMQENGGSIPEGVSVHYDFVEDPSTESAGSQTSVGKWRADSKPRNSLEDSQIAIWAEDVIRSRSVFKFEVFHVNTKEGKGFLPSITAGSSATNGSVHLGTDEAAYAKAMAEGEKIWARMTKDFKEAVGRGDTTVW